MKVRVVGAHNLQSSSTRHTCFLVDGVLGVDAGSLASSLTLKEQSRIKALLITHQHFDHTRDIPTLGLRALDTPSTIDVYGLRETLDMVNRNLLDGKLYPDFTKGLNGGHPKYRVHEIDTETVFKVLDYEVKAYAVSHPVPAVGYIVKSPSGGCFAYTGDTKGDLSQFIEDTMGPEVCFVDVTFPNRLEERAQLTGHMTPSMLASQLQVARDKGLKVPRIVAVHLSAIERDEVASELESLRSKMDLDIAVGHEEMIYDSGIASD